MTHTDFQAKVAKTAAFQGASVDISGITGDWTLVLEVYGLDATDTVRFQFSDSVDAFTTVVAGPTVAVTGQLGSNSPTDSGGASAGLVGAYFPNPRRFTFKKADFPDYRCGTASAVGRLEITRITGTGPSVTYMGFIEF